MAAWQRSAQMELEEALGKIHVAVLCMLGLLVRQCLGAGINCSSLYNRYPANSDITVQCGPSNIVLTIIACPAQFAMFDPATLALNGRHTTGNCNGTVDTTVDPPVVRFVFPINDTTQNSCGNTISILEATGTGDFAAYSKVQTVVISGFVDTPPTLDNGIISYSTNLNYSFTCYYPLLYLLANMEILTSSANVAINTNNGTFISTLGLQIYTDSNFTNTFQINGTALPLKQTVYVQVTATNLTADFNVLLDECFATPSPLLTTTTSGKFSLLTGCTAGNNTNILLNGQGKTAKFTFQTFRFLAHSSLPTSTIYVHCITRLCQPLTCQSYLQACNKTRRRRAAEDVAVTGGATERVTVSAGPIITSDTEAVGQASSSSSSESAAKQLESTLTGLIVGIVVAALLGAALVIGSIILYRMSRLRASQNEKKNGVDNFTFTGK
ncbi:zona pellucida-like domain-containing protein 1 [Hyperolius riggenbachi]|uniref:zona pellucida-like domain-containing protein 1 n=1 Tax=Hyperolius riggenbachi TaxID=752182 RepID=UPI0035A33998